MDFRIECRARLAAPGDALLLANGANGANGGGTLQSPGQCDGTNCVRATAVPTGNRIHQPRLRTWRSDVDDAGMGECSSPAWGRGTAADK